MKKIVCAVLLLIASVNVEAQTNGAFIEFIDGAEKYSWNDVLGDMRRRGMTTAIVQFTRDTKETEYWTFLGQILDAATTHRINVYVGLQYDTRWYTSDIGDLLSDSKKHATAIHTRFGKRARFRGWYIPQEITNDLEALPKLQGYFQPLLKHIRGFRDGRPIAVSAYFNPRLTCPVDFARHVRQLAAFDRILLQDGVGERGMRDLQKEVVPYFQAFHDEFGKKRMWAVNEAFCCTTVNADRECTGERVPTDSAHLQSQVDATRAFVSHTIAFEYLQFVGKPAGTCQRRDPQECSQPKTR